jgi:hypothetical protein
MLLRGFVGNMMLGVAELAIQTWAYAFLYMISHWHNADGLSRRKAGKN